MTLTLYAKWIENMDRIGGRPAVWTQRAKCPWILNECDGRMQRGDNICEIVKRHVVICGNGPPDIREGVYALISVWHEGVRGSRS